MKKLIAVSMLALSCHLLSAQTLRVKIIHRVDNETEYTWSVPEYSVARSTANANCFGDTSVYCQGSETTTTSTTPAQSGSFHVRGATFLLVLPDGRGVVVNCESKFAERFAGRAGNHRSCRIPLVDDIDLEFNGDKAKLKWSVSIDGTKIQSETYKVLGIFDKPKSDQN
jgi:hypothetical protein